MIETSTTNSTYVSILTIFFWFLMRITVLGNRKDKKRSLYPSHSYITKQAISFTAKKATITPPFWKDFVARFIRAIPIRASG